VYLDDRNEVTPVLAEDVLTGLQATHHLLILSFLFILYKLLKTALSNGQITIKTPNPKGRPYWYPPPPHPLLPVHFIQAS
jgi:hypothetical protein